MWALPIDIMPEHSGLATGLMCVGGSLAAFLSPVTTGFPLDVTGSWSLPFMFTAVLLLAGIVLAFFIHPDREFTNHMAQPSRHATASVLPRRVAS